VGRRPRGRPRGNGRKLQGSHTRVAGGSSAAPAGPRGSRRRGSSEGAGPSGKNRVLPGRIPIFREGEAPSEKGSHLAGSVAICREAAGSSAKRRNLPARALISRRTPEVGPGFSSFSGRSPPSSWNFLAGDEIPPPAVKPRRPSRDLFVCCERRDSALELVGRARSRESSGGERSAAAGARIPLCSRAERDEAWCAVAVRGLRRKGGAIAGARPSPLPRDGRRRRARGRQRTCQSLCCWSDRRQPGFSRTRRMHQSRARRSTASPSKAGEMR
jgi:hypothetical protein